MHLIEVVIAGSVFAVASSSSMQLWSNTAVQAHQLTSREQLEQRIEQDRLQLQTLWQNQLMGPTQQQIPATQPITPVEGAGTTQPAASATGTASATTKMGCLATAEQLLTLASNLQAPMSVRRQLALSPDGNALQIHWSGVRDASIKRDRFVTPAGLGLCGVAPTASETLLPTAGAQPEATQPSDQDPATPTPVSSAPLTVSQMEGAPS